MREREGGQIRHAQRDGAWHPFISSAGFIFGLAIAALSRGRQSPAEPEKRVGCMWLWSQLL